MNPVQLSCRETRGLPMMGAGRNRLRKLWLLLPVVLLMAHTACQPGAPVARKKLPGLVIASPYREGLALVRETESRRYGYLDREGRIAIAARFAEAQPFSQGLAAVRERAGGPYGYIDPGGRMAIPAVYEAAFAFSEGLATVQVDGKQGCIDRTGAVRAAARFDRVAAFSGGRARVIERGLAGFIDADGAVAVPPSFFKAGDYRDGLAAACARDKCGYIDKAGRWVIEPRFDDAGEYAEGRAPVRAGGRWGYIDREGRWVVEPAFDEAHPFREGAALVARWMAAQPDRGYGAYTGPDLVYGFIDAGGGWVIEPAIRGASGFSGGLARIRVPAGQWLCSDCYGAAYVRKDGSLIRGFSAGGDFSEGAAVVTADRGTERPGFVIDERGAALLEFDGADFTDPAFWAARSARLRYGYTGPRGEIVLPHRYFSAEPFSEGLGLVREAQARRGSRLVYVDRTGAARVAPPKGAAAAEPFSEGFALVTIHAGQPQGSRYVYIDRTGAVRIEGNFAAAQPFSEGLAAVKTSREPGTNNWGYINTRGEMAIPPGFNAAGPFWRGLALVSSIENSVVKGGAIDRTGALAIPAFYPEDAPRDVWKTLREFRGLGGPRDLVPVRTQPGFAYAGRDGRIAIREPRYGAGREFSEGRAAVMLAERGRPGRWGYIDEKGRLVIEARYLEARPFSGGMAAVKDEAGRYGYLKPDGRWAIPPAFFEEAHDFREGRALVRLNGFYGYLDGSGALAVPARYPRASSFSEGLAATGLAVARRQ